MALGNLIKNAAGSDKPRYELSDDITFRFVCSSYSLEVSDKLSYATLHIPHDHVVGGRNVRYDLRESLLECLNSKPAKVYDTSAYEVRRKWFADRGSFRQVDYNMIMDPWGKWIPWYRTARQAVSGRLVKCDDGAFIEIQVFTINSHSAIAKAVILIPVNIVGGFLAYVDVSWKEEGLCRYGV